MTNRLSSAIEEALHPLEGKVIESEDLQLLQEDAEVDPVISGTEVDEHGANKLVLLHHLDPVVVHLSESSGSVPALPSTMMVRMNEMVTF